MGFLPSHTQICQICKLVNLGNHYSEKAVSNSKSHFNKKHTLEKIVVNSTWLATKNSGHGEIHGVSFSLVFCSNFL